MELAAVDYQEPSLVWLFRKKIRGFDTGVNGEDARDWMNQTVPRVCVMPASEVKGAFGAMNPAWRVVTAGGFDVANARKVELAAVIKM